MTMLKALVIKHLTNGALEGRAVAQWVEVFVYRRDNLSSTSAPHKVAGESRLPRFIWHPHFTYAACNPDRHICGCTNVHLRAFV